MSHSLSTSDSDRPGPRAWSRPALGHDSPPGARGGSPDRFEPPLDVYETAEGLVVRVEIAGLDPEQLQVHLASDDQTLTITGRRQDPGAGSPRKYYTMEIQCGEFSRQIALPLAVDTGAARASYADGFLEVVLPRQRQVMPRSRNVPIQ